MKGFSERNIRSTRLFYEEYADDEKWQQLVAKLPCKQGVNFCGYKINPYRLKLRTAGKKRLKDKVKTLQEKVKLGKISSKEAKKFLAGHYGYIKIANTYNLEQKLFPATFTEY